MTRGLLSIAIHSYGVAAVIYLTYLIRQFRLLPWVGRAVVGFGLALHATSLGAALWEQGGMPVGISQGFSLVALLLLAIFLGLDFRYRTPVLGAFLTPIALALLIPAVMLAQELPVPVLSAEYRRPLLPVHIAIALLGMAAFAVASGVAGMYLLMERQMKGKKFGLLFSRLPPLHFLDELNRRLVVGGFVALSVTLITGAFFASKVEGLFWHWAPKEVATLVAWVGFGTLLMARLFAGWQGRRVAMLTMAGFGLLLVSFLSAYDPVSVGAIR